MKKASGCSSGKEDFVVGRCFGSQKLVTRTKSKEQLNDARRVDDSTRTTIYCMLMASTQRKRMHNANTAVKVSLLFQYTRSHCCCFSRQQLCAVYSAQRGSHKWTATTNQIREILCLLKINSDEFLTHHFLSLRSEVWISVQLNSKAAEVFKAEKTLRIFTGNTLTS